MANIIEFMGIPGAGKSTIYSLVKQKILKNNVEIFNYRGDVFDNLIKNSKGFQKFKYFILYKCSKTNVPLLYYKESVSNILFENEKLIYSLKSIILKADIHRQKIIFNFCLDNIIELEYSVNRNNNFLHLIDEGITHRLSSIGYCFSKDDMAVIDFIYEVIDVPKILVIILCPFEEAITRAQLRKRGLPKSLKKFSELELMKYYKSVQYNMKLLADKLEKKGTKIIYFDNSNYSYSNKIKEQINELIDKFYLE